MGGRGISLFFAQGGIRGALKKKREMALSSIL